jgi:hypothetical protein
MMNTFRRLFSLAGVLTALVAIAAVASAGAGTYVPFRGMDTLVATLHDNGDGTVDTASSGEGNATQLGKFTVVDDVGTLNLMTGEFSGSYTLIAASGDTLSGEFDGGLTGPTTFHTSGPIVGGTGRFAGAEGTLTFDGVVVEQTASSATVRNTISGTISTVGSSVRSS